MPPRLNFSSAARTSSTLLGRTMLLTSFISGLQNAFEGLRQHDALGLDELVACLRDVQDIDCLPPFGSNQRQIEVAAPLGHGPADPVQQAGRIVRDDLEHRVLPRMLVVEMNPRRLGVAPPVENAALAA